jgi:hypothetical protein
MTFLANRIFSIVDVFDANQDLLQLSHLQNYDAALVWGSGSLEFPFVGAVGDVLAQFWDNGGSVVMAVDAIYDGKLTGRFANLSAGYMLIDGSASGGPTSLDSMSQNVMANDPLLAGVNLISIQSHLGQAWENTGAVINGGTVVASWLRARQPMVMRGMKSGRALVALNLYPVSFAATEFSWGGDGARLIQNAILCSVCAPCGAKYSTAGAFRST